jgi:hypothetical protein
MREVRRIELVAAPPAWLYKLERQRDRRAPIAAALVTAMAEVE